VNRFTELLKSIPRKLSGRGRRQQQPPPADARTRVASRPAGVVAGSLDVRSGTRPPRASKTTQPLSRPAR